jgi:hydroxyacylglutathione hydrolase
LSSSRTIEVLDVFFRQLLNDDTACASYLFGCATHGQFAVVDPHVDLVDEYMAVAEAQGVPIVAVLETHVQADHVSGLPDLVRRTGATAYLPAAAGVEFDHHPLDDGERVRLGNTEIQAVATPGHALAHHAYVVTDHRRTGEPWLVLTGDHLALFPAHYSGSVCGRGLSATPLSTIGFERRNNRALQFDSEDAFVEALLQDLPPAPADQAAIVAANRSGRPLVPST